MKNILVFGGSGQLGQCIQKFSSILEQFTFVFLDEVKGNILNIELLNSLFNEFKPVYIINCAAYTAVDKAEDELELSRKINATGVENLAKLSEQFGSIMIHISTDFVFEGNQTGLLTEEDIANPVGVYGLTKLEGEVAIQQATHKYFTLRTSWLYSEFANNFVKTMLRLGADRPELGVIVDQVGSPTYAVDLAKVILHIIESGSEAYGLYHYSNEGVTSWYDFATTIFELAGLKVKVKALKTSEYPTKAKRPFYSVMDKTKVKQNLAIEVPYWRDSLKRCLVELGY